MSNVRRILLGLSFVNKCWWFFFLRILWMRLLVIPWKRENLSSFMNKTSLLSPFSFCCLGCLFLVSVPIKQKGKKSPTAASSFLTSQSKKEKNWSTTHEWGSTCFLNSWIAHPIYFIWNRFQRLSNSGPIIDKIFDDRVCYLKNYLEFWNIFLRIPILNPRSLNPEETIKLSKKLNIFPILCDSNPRILIFILKWKKHHPSQTLHSLIIIIIMKISIPQIMMFSIFTHLEKELNKTHPTITSWCSSD